MLPERLNRLRRSRGVTAKRMAEVLCVEIRTYRKYESGHLMPDYFKLVRIADILDVSLDYLLCRDDFIARHKNKD